MLGTKRVILRVVETGRVLGMLRVLGIGRVLEIMLMRVMGIGRVLETVLSMDARGFGGANG